MPDAVFYVLAFVAFWAVILQFMGLEEVDKASGNRFKTRRRALIVGVGAAVLAYIAGAGLGPV